MSTIVNKEALTLAERQRLTELEQVVSENLMTFYEVGMALAEIRDNRLYRETHDTFDAYCRERFDVVKTHANRLIGAARVVENLTPMGVKLPANERQARPLTRLKPEDQREVWRKVIEQSPKGATTQIVRRAVSSFLGRNTDGGRRFSSVIKPTDNWNFSRVMFPRVDNGAGYGYLPGDVYANCFWYYVSPGDLVVDPMAAAGMAKVVYDGRDKWMGEYPYEFDLRLYDLTPQAECVVQHDLLNEFPVIEETVDYIVIDPPYYGVAASQYSDKTTDLANMGLAKWVKSMRVIANHCASVQVEGGMCTVIVPNYRNIKSGEIVVVPDFVRQAWVAAGYRMFDVAYSSRRTQQTQSTRMAAVNNSAKERKIMLADIAIVQTFYRSIEP